MSQLREEVVLILSSLTSYDLSSGTTCVQKGMYETGKWKGTGYSDIISPLIEQVLLLSPGPCSPYVIVYFIDPASFINDIDT